MQRIAMSIVPSAGENLIALTSRLVNTCCSRDGSPHTIGLSVGNARLIDTRRAPACGLTVSIADSRIIDGNDLSRSIRSWPVMIRETSSRSLINWFCSRALRSIVSSACVCLIGLELAAAQQVQPAEHRAHRRAQLVAQRREELVLEPCGVLGRAPRSGFALQQIIAFDVRATPLA